MLKDLLKQQMLLRQENQSLSKEVSYLKQQNHELEETLQAAYRWPTVFLTAAAFYLILKRH